MTDDRILGCDISEYQGLVNFNKMEDADAKYVILRKQIGYRTDARFWEYFEAAKKTSLKISIYGVPFVGWDIARQVDQLTEGLDPSDLDFPPEGDIERRHIYSMQYAIGKVLAYMEGLVDWWDWATFYTAKYIWEEKYSSKPGWIEEWDLHVANYTTAPEPWYVPIGWTNQMDGTPVAKQNQYGIWQFSADKNGRGPEFGAQSRDIDLNLMQPWYWDKFIAPPETGEPGDLPADALEQLWSEGLRHGWELTI